MEDVRTTENVAYIQTDKNLLTELRKSQMKTPSCYAAIDKREGHVRWTNYALRSKNKENHYLRRMRRSKKAHDGDARLETLLVWLSRWKFILQHGRNRQFYLPFLVGRTVIAWAKT